MRIALIGTRGIPANYGGFETFAEELTVRLAERGHEVTVYCRATHFGDTYRGVRLRYIPTIRHKYLDTLAHTLFCTADVLLRGGFDVLLYCNAANAIYTLLPRLFGTPTALNVDGLERNRKKWNRLAKGWYSLSEWLATWCCTEIVSDARHIQKYYAERYRRGSTFIAYGAPTGRVPEQNVLVELGLEPKRYVLYVSRLEPENNALLVRKAFEQISGDFRLALVGDAPYASDYIQQVRDTADARILFPGAIYGEGYQQLQSHSAVYIQATEVGGTHPALIEAMGRQAMVLYLDTPENEEVAQGVAVPFTPETLVEKLRWALSLTDSERAEWGERAAERVSARYSWEAVTSDYEALFAKLSRTMPDRKAGAQ